MPFYVLKNENYDILLSFKCQKFFIYSSFCVVKCLLMLKNINLEYYSANFQESAIFILVNKLLQKEQQRTDFVIVNELT